MLDDFNDMKFQEMKKFAQFRSPVAKILISRKPSSIHGGIEHGCKSHNL